MHLFMKTFYKLTLDHMRCRVCIMTLSHKKKKKVPVSHPMQISSFMYCFDTKM